jgi:hypothetical protein
MLFLGFVDFIVIACRIATPKRIDFLQSIISAGRSKMRASDGCELRKVNKSIKGACPFAAQQQLL